MKYQVYQVNWSYHDGTSTTEAIKDWCIGSILNVCCGKSKLGDLRIDISYNLKPDILADAHYLPLRKLSFDTIVLDPPYSYFNKFRWIHRIADTSKKRIVISAGQVAVRIPHFKLNEILAVITNTFYVKLWYVFDRYQTQLSLT